MPLNPRCNPETPPEASLRPLHGESIVAAAQRRESEQLQLLLRALRGEEQGIPADVLESVRLIAPEGRPTHSE